MCKAVNGKVGLLCLLAKLVYPSVAPEGQLDIEKTLGNQLPGGISSIIKKYFKHNQSKHFR
ncbi:hypothetical protein A7M48_21575 [Acinetobacter baumannii]|nr:hypothetical protein A7M48_21575 [Acinetobacter baumannii]